MRSFLAVFQNFRDLEIQITRANSDVFALLDDSSTRVTELLQPRPLLYFINSGNLSN